MTYAVRMPVLYNGQCHYNVKLKSQNFAIPLNYVRWDLVDSLYTTGNVLDRSVAN